MALPDDRGRNGGVPASVVYHDDLEIHVALPQDRREGQSEQLTTVVCRHNNGYLRWHSSPPLGDLADAHRSRKSVSPVGSVRVFGHARTPTGSSGVNLTTLPSPTCRGPQGMVSSRKCR